MMAAYAAFFTSILVKLIMWKNEHGPNIPNEIKVLKTTAETNIMNATDMSMVDKTTYTLPWIIIEPMQSLIREVLLS